MAAVPVFFNVTTWIALAEPTFVAGNTKEEADKLKTGAGAGAGCGVGAGVGAGDGDGAGDETEAIS